MSAISRPAGLLFLLVCAGLLVACAKEPGAGFDPYSPDNAVAWNRAGENAYRGMIVPQDFAQAASLST